jgi:catechol 2,3-dioxygenase-like lactoylglutathione lyase family enzyme
MLQNAVVHPVVPAADLTRAKAFYKDKLGLTPAMESEGGVVYLCRGSWFVLFPSMGAGTAQSTAVEFLVDNLDAEMAELRSRGVVFEEYDYPEFKTVNGVAEHPEGKSAWFKDSEGNTVAVTQILSAEILTAMRAMTAGTPG